HNGRLSLDFSAANQGSVFSMRASMLNVAHGHKGGYNMLHRVNKRKTLAANGRLQHGTSTLSTNSAATSSSGGTPHMNVSTHSLTVMPSQIDDVPPLSNSASIPPATF